MIEEIPEAIRNAVELGLCAGLLAVLAQFPRLVWLYLLVLAGVVGEAFRLQVLNKHWVVDSLLTDAPWGVMAPLLVVAVAAVVLAPRLAGTLPGRMVLLALVPPVAAGHRQMRALWDVALPNRRERAGLILLVSGLGAVVPFFGTAAVTLTATSAAGAPAPQGLGMLAERVLHPGAMVPALAATVVGAIAWAWGRRGAVAPAVKVVAPSGNPLVPLLLTVPLSAVVVWLAIASGVLEFAAQGIEQAPIFLPRIMQVVFALGAMILGGAMDETTLAVAFHEVLARGLSLYDDSLRDTLLVGFSVGSGLPMLFATRARLRFGVPFWLGQVAVVLGWYALSSR